MLGNDVPIGYFARYAPPTQHSFLERVLRNRVVLGLLLFGLILLIGYIRMSIWPFGGTLVQIIEPDTKVFGSSSEDNFALLVCAPPNSSLNLGDERDVVVVYLLASTGIFDQRSASIPLPTSKESIQAGQWVRVWPSGGLMFSYPIQAMLERLDIQEDPDPAVPVECPWQGLEGFDSDE